MGSAMTEKRQAALLPPGAADGKGVLQGGEALRPPRREGVLDFAQFRLKRPDGMLRLLGKGRDVFRGSIAGAP